MTINKIINLSNLIDTTALSEDSLVFVEHDLKNESKYSFVNDKNLDLLKNNLPFEGETIYLIKKESLKLINKYGRNYFDQNIALDYENTNKISFSQLFSSKNDWDNFENLIKNDEYTLAKYYKNKLGCLAFIDLEGHIYSEPILVNDYFLNDKHYYLDDYVEHLIKRDDVAIYSNVKSCNIDKKCLLFPPLKDDNPYLGGIIFDIEHHLEDGENLPEEKEGAFILYYPNQGNIKDILNFDFNTDKNKNFNIQNKNFSLNQIILNNYLNGQSFRKIPSEQLKVKRKFKN